MLGNGRERRFVYKKRDPKIIEERATQQGGAFDSIIKSEFPVFKAQKGDNMLRIMPPTWDGADHYAINVLIHRNVGADNGSYLCLKMIDEPCPLCEERINLVKYRETEAAKAIKPNDARVAWVINREKEADGPQAWIFGWTMDKNIALLCRDKRTGEVLYIDDPEEGYDFLFTKDGEGLKTQYRGEQVARRSSPLCDNQRKQQEWMDFIIDHPIPDILNFYPYNHIMEALHGKPVEEPEQEPIRRRSSIRDQVEEPPFDTDADTDTYDTETGEVVEEEREVRQPVNPALRAVEREKPSPRSVEPEEETPRPRAPQRSVAEPSTQARQGLGRLRPPGLRPSLRPVERD